MANRPYAGRAAARRASTAEPLLAEILQTFDLDLGKVLAPLGELLELRRKYERLRASCDGAILHANTEDDPNWRAVVDAACRRHGVDPADFRAFHRELHEHPLAKDSEAQKVMH